MINLRFRQSLERNNFTCFLSSADSFCGVSSRVEEFIQNNNISLVIGIHAFKSGRVLTSNINY